jgi:hypothetical protein
MCPLARRTIILAMTRPVPSSKVFLLEDRRGGSASSDGAPVRRYRLARLRFDVQAAPEASRFDYLKRSHD